MADAPTIRAMTADDLPAAVAESWAAARGLAGVTLSARDDRAGAHAFYGRLGYRRAATARIFSESLSD